jgi:hypothetical protein
VAYHRVKQHFNHAQHFVATLNRSQRNALRLCLTSGVQRRDLKQALGLPTPKRVVVDACTMVPAPAATGFTCPACMARNDRFTAGELQHRCGVCGAHHSTYVLLEDGWAL